MMTTKSKKGIDKNIFVWYNNVIKDMISSKSNVVFTKNPPGVSGGIF